MSSSLPGQLSGVRILIVEDETMIAMLLEGMLLELGCVVAGVAVSVATALEMVGGLAVHADCALLDVNLGGEAAFPVAAALCERQVPFAFVTGYGRSAIAQQYSGAPVLQKPFKREDLLALIGSIVRG